MRRDARIAIAVLALVVALVPASPAGSQAAPDDNRRGLVYAGLRKASRTEPCRGNFELVHRDVSHQGVRQVLCTHGPDPAPEGVDVRQSRAPVSGAAQGTQPAGGTAGATGALPCYGNGSDGFRVQVLYARASNVGDRYASYASSFVQWTIRMNDVVVASAAETGGVRNVRLLTDASCNLVVGRVTLSTTGDDNFNNTIAELRAQGYNRIDRKYLVFVDANVYCGIAQVYYDDTQNPVPGVNASNGHPQVPGEVARVDNGCWGQANSIEAHELVHTLGGVQTSAPNATSANHCRDESDLMCYADGSGAALTYRCPTTHENRLDCNHEDYFSTNPAPGNYLATHWNTATSAFLSADPPSPPPAAPPPTTTTTTVPPPTTTTAPPPTTTTVPATTTTTKPATTTTTTIPAVSKPSAPRNLMANTPLGLSGIRLGWQAPVTGPVSSYRVYRSTSPASVVQVGTTGGSTTTYTDITAARGVSYSYYVTAMNAAGQGPASNVVLVSRR